MTTEAQHPMQPLAKDGRGVMRFRENALVRYLLDKGGIDMNHLAEVAFPVEDREQFAQLIGYSLSGFAELSYVRDDTFAAAQALADNPSLTEEQARIQSLEQTLRDIRAGLRVAAVAAFPIHPDDLGEGESDD